MFWAHLSGHRGSDSLQQRVDRLALERDPVDAVEQRILLQLPLRLQDLHNLHRRPRPLDLLPVEQLRLELVEALLPSCLHKRLRALAVPPAVAGHDQVRDPARLEERRVLYLRVVRLDEALHLHHPDADDRRLGVVAKTHAVHEAGAKRNHVLQRSADLHSRHVLPYRHVEVGVVEQALQQGAVRLVPATDGRLAELPRRHLRRKVRSHEHAHVHAAHALLDHVRDQDHTLLVEVHALDQ
mmetsp:Transcript_28713/g.92648  ORF Transcript_28713/g.92648 Transcript_28713/m.92648 type:complete len:240 (-) Transcript_28713:552-1271(-)